MSSGLWELNLRSDYTEVVPPFEMRRCEAAENRVVTVFSVSAENARDPRRAWAERLG